MRTQAEKALLGGAIAATSPAEPHLPTRAPGGGGAAGPAMIAISGYRSRYDTHPVPAIVRWDALATRLARPRLASCSVADCIGRDCPHKCGTLWSPASIAQGKTRLNEWVTSVSVLVLDADHVPTDADLAAIVDRITPYRHVVHATHSDRAGDRCVRVMLQLSRPAAGEEWPPVWSGAIELLGIPVDGMCKDPSRAYYAPSRPRDGDYYYLHGDGTAIDVDELVARAPQRITRPSPRSFAPASPFPDDDRIRRARAYVAQMDTRGSDALFLAVCRAMHGFELDDTTTRSVVIECFISRCGAPWAERDIDRKIAEARNKVRDRDDWRVDSRREPFSRREPTPNDLRSAR